MLHSSPSHHWQVRISVVLAVGVLAVGAIVADAQAAAVEKIVAQLKLICDGSGDVGRTRYDNTLPFVYASLGDKSAALSALDDRDSRVGADASKVKSDPQVFVRRQGSASPFELAWCSSEYAGPEHQDERKCFLMFAIVNGQLRAGDKAGAASTADELFATVKKIGNVGKAEKGVVLDCALRAFGQVGAMDKLKSVIDLCGNDDPDIRTDMVAILARAGDYAKAVEAADVFTDARARAEAYCRVADWQIHAGHTADAVALISKAVANGFGNRDCLELLIRHGDAASVDPALAKAGAAARSMLEDGAFQIAGGKVNAGQSSDLARILSLCRPSNRTFGPAIALAKQCATNGNRAGTKTCVIFAARSFMPTTHPADPHELSQYATLQHDLGETISLGSIADDLVDAYGANGQPGALGDMRPPIEILVECAEVQIWAGHKEVAGKLLRKAFDSYRHDDNGLSAYPEVYLRPLLRIAALQATIGEADASNQAMGKAVAEIATISREKSHSIATALLAGAQIQTGKLIEAVQSLGKIRNGLQYDENPAQLYGDMRPDPSMPEFQWVQLGIKQSLAGDKTAAAASFEKAVEVAKHAFNPHWKERSFWGYIAEQQNLAGETYDAMESLGREPKLMIDGGLLLRIALADADTLNPADTKALLGRFTNSDAGARDYALAALTRPLLSKGDYKAAVELAESSGANPTAIPDEVFVAAAKAGDAAFIVAHVRTLRQALSAAASLPDPNSGDAKQILARGLAIFELRTDQ